MKKTKINLQAKLHKNIKATIKHRCFFNCAKTVDRVELFVYTDCVTLLHSSIQLQSHTILVKESTCGVKSMNKKEIQELAKSKLEQAGLFTTPIKIGKLLEYHDFIMLSQPMNNCLGFIVVDVEDPLVIQDKEYPKFIMVNSNDGVERQRFTVAHELAHYFIEGCCDSKLYAHRDLINTPNTQEEVLANKLAAQLLAPYHLVKRFVNKNIGSDEDVLISDLSYEFGISYSAAKVRYAQY